MIIAGDSRPPKQIALLKHFLRFVLLICCVFFSFLFCVVPVEAGACPHTIIREDPSLNIAAADKLNSSFPELDVIFIESGGDNLASTFSLDLVDYWMFVIDTGAGDDIPRKKGPGIIRSDVLVVNKIDIGPYVGANVDLIKQEAVEVRNHRPTLLTDCKRKIGIDVLVEQLIQDVLFTDV